MTNKPSFGSWLVQLGNAGAVRNAAAVCAERRAAEMRAEAVARRFERALQQIPPQGTTPGEGRIIARTA